VDTEPTAPPRPSSSRPWLAAAGIALVVACVVPPLSVLARRYLFVESIQFCAFALAAPALIALGARRRRQVPFVATLSYLIAWVMLCVIWRLPSVLDELARHPVLVLPEAVTLSAAGLGLWLDLVSPPLDLAPAPLDLAPAPLDLVPAPASAPRRARPERALVAALAMWSLWAIAYVLGFAHDSVVHAYDPAGSHLGTVADQEITAFLLWAAAGAAFAPVVFTVLFAWLRDGTEPARKPVGSGVRGWGPR
jgi:hypothetical protein